MKYWVYINNKVDGPYDENSLATITGFTPQTLICSEEVASNGGQEWVKASSVFEFDETPVTQETTAAQIPAAAVDSSVSAPLDTQALLARLDALSNTMVSLQTKLDSMQSHLDQALEENKKLAHQQQIIRQAAVTQQPADLPAMQKETPVEEKLPSDTLTLPQPDVAKEQPTDSAPVSNQAELKEEELVIQSALNSMYGEKPVSEPTVTDTPEDESFHDLVTGETSADLARAEEEEAVRDIETQLHFTPVKEEEPEVNKAVITTPSVFEAEKDALINELTSSPKEDILDQIITEHQQEQSSQTDAPSSGESSKSTFLEAGVAAAAVTASTVMIPQSKPFSISTDKNNPSQLEQVFSAAQMPEDVLPPDTLSIKDTADTDLPFIEKNFDTPTEPAVGQTTQKTDIPITDMPDELPPLQTAVTEKLDMPVADTPTDLPQKQELAQQDPEIPVADMPDELPQPQESVATEKPNMVSADEIPDAATMIPSKATVESVGMLSVDDLPTPDNSSFQQQPEETLPEELLPAKNEDSFENFDPALEPEPAVAQESAVAQEPAVATQEPAQEPAEPQPATPQEISEPQEVAQEQTPSVSPEAPVRESASKGEITEKDLQDAFGNKSSADETPLPIAEDDFASTNPDELTEIELKQGATYLISDFVPPAQVTDDVAAVMNSAENANKKDAVFQDMLAAATLKQSAKPLSTDGLPEEISATQVNLENTIQAKRGATLDIKTVPMVPDPTKTDRIHVDELTDVNAQHDIKKQGLAKSTKLVIGGLVSLLLMIIVYVVLGFLHVLPDSVNILTPKKQAEATAQNVQELLNEELAPAAVEEEKPAQPAPQQQALEKVQNFTLPNDNTLKGFIESKHATISPELITWEVTDAVEPDNYSVTVKVPPENPQSFKTVYRFNYNMQTGMLDPTISDAKNLLDQAYGKTQEVQTKPAEEKKAPAKRKTGTRRTSRKR